MIYRSLTYLLIALVWTTLLARPVLSAQPAPEAGEGRTGLGPEVGLTEFVPPTLAETAAALTQPLTTTYTTAEGLADNRLWTIAAGADNRLWFGTYEQGVSVFEGQSWSRYTTAEGLADNDVRAVLPLANGEVWFGTGGGVSHFDGQHWRTFTWADGLASSGVEALALDRAGHLWATHLAEGVSYFDGTAWTVYTTADGLADNWVHAVALDPPGRVWFGTNAGVSVFDGQNWQSFTTAEGVVDETVFALTVTANGHVWAGTAGGLSEYDGQQWLTHLPGRPITGLTTDPSGALWAVGGGSVNRFAGQQWTDVTPAHLVGQDIRTVASDGTGQIWVGTFGGGATRLTLPRPADRVWVGTTAGVSRFDGQAWTSYTTANGLVDDEVRAVAIDPQGRKWFGTANGVSLFDGQTWTSYQPLTNSLVSNFVQTVAIDPANRAWFGYGERGQGVTVFDGQSWTTYTTADGLVDDRVYAVDFAPDGSAWLGTGAGVSHFTGRQWTSYTSGEGLLDDRVRTVAVGPEGTLWVGTESGASRFDGQSWQNITAADGLVAGPINAIAFDRQGRVWLGAQPLTPGDGSGGLSSYDGQRWTSYPFQTSYNDDSFGLQGNWVTAIAFDADDRPWVGLEAHALSKPLWVRGGLSMLNERGWNNYSGDVGLVSSHPTSIAIDGAGNKWVGSTQGLFRFNGGPPPVRYTSQNGLLSDEVREVAIDQSGRIWAATWGGGVAVLAGDRWTTYHTTGLADREINAIAIDSAGTPWFATPGGVSHFDGQKWTVYTVAEGLLDQQARAIVADAAGNIWVGTGQGGYFGGGVSHFDGQNWRGYTTADGLPRNNISAVALDKAGAAWAVSYTPGEYGALSGLSRFAGEQWLSPEAGPLADDAVHSLVFDPQGRAWFGTDGSYQSGPLVTFDGRAWLAYDATAGLAAQQVYALAVDSAGRKWLGTDKGVAVLDGQTWTTYSPAEGLAGETVLAIATEPVVADFAGAWRSTDPHFPFDLTLVQTGSRLHGWHCGTLPDGSRTDCRPVDSPDYSLTGTITGSTATLHFVSGYSGAAGQATLTRTGDDLAWHITTAPAAEFYLPQQARLEKQAEPAGTRLALTETWTVLRDLGQTFTHVAAGPTGPLWAVNESQLLKIDNEALSAFDLPADLREKIAANPSLAFPTITALAATADAVWLGTDKSGLYHFSGAEWRHFSAADGLPAEAVLRLTVDSQGRVWVVLRLADNRYALTRRENERWQPLPLPDVTSAPTGLAVTPAGEAWLAVPGRAPFRWAGQQWDQPTEGWTAGSFDMFVAAGPAGHIWFGSDNGWQRWTGQAWQGVAVTIPAPFSYPVAVDATGGAWGLVTPFCYWCKLPNLNENGAVYVTPEQSCRFTAADGLGGPPLEPPPYAFDPDVVRPDAVRDIALAEDGRVWFITQGQLTVFSPQDPVCSYAGPEKVRQSE